jgi:Transposase zinc-binding domain/Putative transposase
VKKLFESFTRCGDLHFGFLRVRCVNQDCTRKGELLLPYSCKTRGLCPSCGQRRAIAWAERMVEEVLPRVPYRQLVFTIPRRLRKYFQFDRSLYGELARAAYASTRDYLRKLAPGGFPKLKRAVPAMVVVPQSFGDLLVSHPHAHALVSLGIFTRDGSFHSMEAADFSGLEAIFRERVFLFMIERGKITPEVRDGMRAWPHSGFQVDFHRKIEAGERQELEGLLTYMDRPPVSLKRLTYRSEGLVHYQGTRLHPRLGIDHQLLPPVDFLALLSSHVLLRYQVTLRTYGAISTTFRKRVGWIERPPVEDPPRETHTAAGPPLEESKPRGPARPPTSPLEALRGPHDGEAGSLAGRRRSWARLIRKTWLVDPSLCGSCGQPMKVLSAISSPEQDDVIERILKARGEWDPPWSRPCRARGPPASSRPTPPPGARTIDPEWKVEDYYSDPGTLEDP